MTNEEAIQTLKEDRALYEGDIVEAGDGTPDGQLLLALDMAIEALEKQVPKKPIKHYYLDRYCVVDYYYQCPTTCNVKFQLSNTYHFCPNCGQALDWRDFK